MPSSLLRYRDHGITLLPFWPVAGAAAAMRCNFALLPAHSTADSCQRSCEHCNDSVVPPYADSRAGKGVEL